MGIFDYLCSGKTNLTPVKINFGAEALSEIYQYGTTKDRKYQKLCRNKKLVESYIRVVSIMYDVNSSKELKPFSFLHYERLKHRPMSSVRLVNGMVERLLFTETESGIEIELIEIDSTHYGNK